MCYYAILQAQMVVFAKVHRNNFPYAGFKAQSSNLTIASVTAAAFASSDM